MNAPKNFVLYGLNRLGPWNIANEMGYMRADGFTTIVIGMFHIGNPAVKSSTQLGDIIFNGDEPIVIRDGKFNNDPVRPNDPNVRDWPGQIAQLKASPTTVQKVYATFGGGEGVFDFSTIRDIYSKHGTFEGTQLKTNLEVFRQTFPAFDGIDMDCEDTYDIPSFVAFCDLLIKMGYDITFCPYWDQGFWNEALAEIERMHPNAVKWWNLQCYDGGSRNNPQEWAPPGKPAGYIIPGDWVRFWNDAPDRRGWHGDCPDAMQKRFAGFASQPCVGGGFLWSLDLARDTGKNAPVRGNGCGGNTANFPVTYLEFIKRGLGS
jgi:hypothetical protein